MNDPVTAAAQPLQALQGLNFWQSAPKVLLHEHLDGGLRPATLLALCRARNIPLPVGTAAALALWLQGNANSGSLERYVAAFAPIVAAMATAAACEQVAFEAAEDARLDGCVLAEFRMAPLLLEPHGMVPEAAVEAMVRGLQRSALPAALIVCGMRTDSAAQVERAAHLAVRYAGQGVVGFDLAGAEKGFPATHHRRAIDIARAAGLGITLHAGEADGGHRVLEAIELGATRIGHGVHIALASSGESPAHVAQRMAEVAAVRVNGRENGRAVHFEVCLTSNTHTGVCSQISQHPLPAMLAAGLEVSVQTDNRLISGVTHSGELHLAHSVLGMSLQDLVRSARCATGASFLADADKTAALEKISTWALGLG